MTSCNIVFIVNYHFQIHYEWSIVLFCNIFTALSAILDKILKADDILTTGYRSPDILKHGKKNIMAIWEIINQIPLSVIVKTLYTIINWNIFSYN